MAATSDATTATPPESQGASAISEHGLELVKSAHYELLEAYVEVLAFTTRKTQKSSLRVSQSRRFIRTHVRCKLKELIDPYTFLRASAVEDDVRSWYERAIESLERFHDSLPHRSFWQVVRGSVLTVWGIIFAIVSLVGVLGGFEVVNDWAKGAASEITKVGFLEDTLYGALGGMIGAVILIPELALFWLLGFYGKREIFLGSASDVVAVRKKQEGEGFRAGKNIYQLEKDLFSAIGFEKVEEKQLDQNLALILASLILVQMFLYMVSTDFSSMVIISVYATMFGVYGLAGAVMWLAKRRNFK